MVCGVLWQLSDCGDAVTGLSHSITGAAIGKLLPWPLAIPVAVGSHFVLDALPHFGEIFEKRQRFSKSVWTADIILTAVFIGFLIASRQWVLLVSALAAMSPDFAWIYRFTVQERFGKLPPRPENKFNAWHARIQRYESRGGLVFEIIWLVCVSGIFIVL